MRVAYLVNQYPHVSHSFIRREIQALQSEELQVLRISIRRPAIGLVDADDQAELLRTLVLLDAGLGKLAAIAVWTALTRPLAWSSAARLAWRYGRASGKRLRSAVYLAEACLLLRILRRHRIDHLHAHFGTNPADVAAFTRKLGGPPYSFTVHGPEEFDRPQALSLGEKIAGARFVVAISSFGRSQLYRWCDADNWPKAHVVHCGVDGAFLDGGPLPPASAARMVCVGRLAEQKGQLILLAAAARLAASGQAFELVLAGDGPMRPALENEIARLGLAGRVRITGWLSNAGVRAEIAAARIFVLPSFAEGLPVVLMEALALGRPVVTTSVAGIPELVEQGRNGWLVPAGDVAALAIAMGAALQADTATLTAMGVAGFEAVKSRHHAPTEAAKLAALFAPSLGGS